MAPVPENSPMESALREEASRNLSLLSAIRFAGVSVALACSAFVGLSRGLPEWRANLAVFAAYWLLSAALWGVVRRRPGLARAAAYGLVLVDIPMVFWIQLLILQLSPSPGGVASFTLAVYCAFVALAALSLDRWLTVSTACAALLFDLVLMRAAGTHAGAQAVAGVVLCGVAAGGWRLVRRVRALIEQVADDELKRRTLERFFPRRLVERLLSDRDLKELEPRIGESTILFFDIRGFSRLAEGSGEGVLGFQKKLRSIMTAMTDEILREEGVVLQYLGDGILACWNAPFPDPRHAERACRAAVGMARRLGEVDPSLRCGIGLHTGRVVAGTIGSEQIFAYGIVGAAINQASRVEHITKHLETSILATRAVTDGLRPESGVSAVPVGTFRPAGMSAALELYELSAASADDRRAGAFRAAVRALERGEWAGVREALASLSAEGGAARYLARLAADYERNPPPAWDGVIQLDQK